MLPFGSAGPVLHNLLVFGPLVLEPYLHLEIGERERGGVKSGHVSTQVPTRVLPLGGVLHTNMSIDYMQESYWTSCNQF